MVRVMQTVAKTKFIGNQALICSPVPFQLEDGEYIITIEPKRKRRSLEQNSYFWALVMEICKKEDGYLKEKEATYGHLLQMAGVKYCAQIIKHEALQDWLNITKVSNYMIVSGQVVKGVAYDTVYVFLGSSRLDTAQMSELIDVTLRYASEVGVENVDDYWRNILNDN